jgi:hypothetical protein
MTNAEDISEQAEALLSSLTESFSEAELMGFEPEIPDEDEIVGIDDISSINSQTDDSTEYIIIDDEPTTFGISSTKEVPNDGTLGYITPIDDEGLDHGETIQTTTSTMSVPFEEAPRFRIYWRAWKEGNSTSGQTESNLETAQMARAEAMTKLYDLGFTDLEILAIETIKNEEKPESQI